MRPWLLLPLLALLASPPWARGADLTFGAEAEGGWSSNPASLSDGPDSWLTRTGPTVKLQEPRGDLTYSLYYRARYDAYYQVPGFDGWEHYLDADGTWQMGPNTTLRLGNLFQYLPLASTQFQNVTALNNQPIPGQLVTVFGNNKALLNYASATLQHSFTPLWQMQGSLSNSLYEPQNSFFVPSISTVGQLTAQYRWDRTNQFGAGVGVTDQRFLSTDNTASSEAQYYNVYGVWVHEFSPTLTLNAQVGPTFVDAGSQKITTREARLPVVARDQNGLGALFQTCTTPPGAEQRLFGSCTRNQTVPNNGFILPFIDPNTGLISGFPASSSTANFPVLVEEQPSSSVSTTYFADVSLTKRWETLTSTLSYRRAAGSSGGLGSASVVDTVSGIVTWKPTEMWNVTLTALWDRRESVTEGVNPDVKLNLLVEPIDVFSPSGGTTTRQVFAQSSAVLVSTRNIEISRYLVTLQAERRIWKRLTVYGLFTYLNQSQKDEFDQANVNYDTIALSLGLRFEFDPIQF